MNWWAAYRDHVYSSVRQFEGQRRPPIRATGFWRVFWPPVRA